MGKAKLEFIARITTEDGSVVERKVSAGESIISPSEVDQSSLDGFLDSFESFEKPMISARDQIGKEIAQAWLEEQAKKKSSGRKIKK